MKNLKNYAVTYSVVALCVIVYVMQLFTGDRIDFALFFIPEKILGELELWRIITPAFLHFGLLHIAFNVLIFNFFGRPLERYFGSFRLLLMVVVFAAFSNFIQYALTGSYTFGGLSGVVSGVIGYCVIISTVPRSDMIFKMSVGLCFVNIVFNVIEYLSESHVAFGAHAAGLAAGLVWGVIDWQRMNVGSGRRESLGVIPKRIMNVLRNR